MHISKSRRALKPCFIELCPHCRKTGQFWLIELSGSVGPIGGIGYSVACGRCSFEKLLSNAEAKTFAELAGIYSQFVAGSISSEAFEKVVSASGFRAIEEIRKESLVWICSKCSEENPFGFEICWNCSHESPHAGPATDFPTPKLPDVGGRLPWE